LPGQALGVLERARRLGIAPNTIMFNTAMSALAKSGRAAAAEQLFAQIPDPDAVSYEVPALAFSFTCGQATCHNCACNGTLCAINVW
jgi:pentatricopeptide repeat protein